MLFRSLSKIAPRTISRWLRVRRSSWDSFCRNTFSRFSSCRIFFFPSSISAVTSSRVFYLGFVMAGRSFLLMGKRKEQFILTALSLIRFYLILEYCRLDLTNIRFRNHHIHLKHNLRRLLYFPLRHETFYL